jgi:PAS domain S-box-containing protein
MKKIKIIKKSIIRLSNLKKTQNELRKINYYYRELIESSIDSLVTIGFDVKIMSVNKATEKSTGYKKKELVGKDFSDYFTEPEKAQAVYLRVSKEGKIKDYPLSMKHRNGRVTPVLYNAAVYNDEKGKAAGVFAAARDITGLKKAENEVKKTHEHLEKLIKIRTAEIEKTNTKLKEAEALYRELVEQAPAGIIIIDPETTLPVDFNDMACGQLGYSREEFKKLGIADYQYGESPEKIREHIDKILKEGRVYFETTHKTKNGGLKNILVTKKRMEIRGKFVVYATFRDITPIRKAEEDIKNLVVKLERSNKELEQFAYVASHDLQEPLRAITGYIQLLEKKYSGKIDEDADRYIKASVAGAGRMRNLINDLLAFSRIESKEREFKEVDMNAVFDTVVYGLNRVIAESGAEITKDSLPVVTADETQMVQLLQNLLGNAVKFRGADKARIHVGIKNGKTEYVFSVKDNGIGIEPQYFEKIFVIFQRLHTREEYPGTGIGLSICKKIVERHGGRIWVESEKGKGTVCYFTIIKEAQNDR